MKNLLVGILMLIGAHTVHAQAIPFYVVAEDVSVQYIRGEIRFCERENVDGLLCKGKHPFLQKKLARDWWSVETYVQYRTGLNEFTLYGVQPTPDNRGLVIYYSP